MEQNMTRAIPTSYFGRCKNTDNHTLCNSLLLEETHAPNECMSAILRKKRENECTYRKLHFRNYFIKLEQNTIYAVIVAPIKLKITCGDKDNVYNLQQNRKIDFADHCDVHKITNDFYYDGSTSKRTEINMPLYKPNFSIYDSNHEKWSYEIQVIDKYNLKMDVLKSETESLAKNIRLFPKTGYAVENTNVFSSIWNFVCSSIASKIGISVICMIIFILVIFILSKMRIFSFQL